MLPAPFYTEVPHDLGEDSSWWGRNLIQALKRLCWLLPEYRNSEPIHDHGTSASPAATAVYARHRRTESSPCGRRLELA